MNKQEKKRTEEFMQILMWANDEIKKSIEKQQYESALDILEQCQDAAIGLGTLIEGSEGEGFVTVRHIEKFCEQIYQIHESIIEKGRADAVSTFRAISKSLTIIENSIRDDITVSKIAVFLPYKASMWDALESVWKAADADPNCDAYVIPIPYYEKNPDGSFGKMHYEGNDYPSEVPITDYQTFDFSKNRPDMIFIHNPADERNALTSVHPFFYASKLKELTDMLIYIPYFVLGEIDRNNKYVMEDLKNYCLLPGIIHSDYVFVQSENMRQAYIQILTEWAGKDTRAVWERKIKGLGSPKFDRVNSYNFDKRDLPDTWEKIIFKADGMPKKVILYNTGLRAMLYHKEEMLAKVERALEIFYENREEVALLWRPHPLILESLLASSPQTHDKLKEVIENYKKAGWGIYDDTPDLDRAIALSDAYYGDMSSVVQLFQEVKKPVMIQNVTL